MEKPTLASVTSIIESVLSKELARAVAASGNAINRSVPLYLGSEAHVKLLAIEILRNLNKTTLFVDMRIK